MAAYVRDDPPLWWGSCGDYIHRRAGVGTAGAKMKTIKLKGVEFVVDFERDGWTYLRPIRDGYAYLPGVAFPTDQIGKLTETRPIEVPSIQFNTKGK